MSNQGTLNKDSENENIDKEVFKLLKGLSSNSERNTYQILEDLKKKYKDSEIVELIFKKYKSKLNKVTKIAEKIKNKLVAKFPGLSIKNYINKISDYQKKYNFDDNEMDAIIKLIFYNNKAFVSGEGIDMQYTAMSKALGFKPASFNTREELSVSADEMEHLDQILQLEAINKELHNQVTLQSLVYQDVALSALNGSVDKTRPHINIFNYIHPVLVAFFLPKFDYVDEHMLIASISKIVSLRRERHQITTQPDYELYTDICLDPSETACVNDSRSTRPFYDLLRRARLQTQIWNNVLNLRQGKYFLNDLNSFVQSIDDCKNNIFDAADFAYVKDEGTIVRKLLSAFSMRPTVVATTPVMGISNLTSPVASIAASHIITVSMLNLRINVFPAGGITKQVNLIDALSQQQLFIHKRQLTVKTQDVLFSREILVFYVHRRFQNINLSGLIKPYEMAFLPVTMNQFEKLNQTKVIVPITINVQSQKFELKSSIVVNTVKLSNKNRSSNDLIISCSAIVRDSGRNGNAIIYEPLDVSPNASVTQIQPMKTLPLFPNAAAGGRSMIQLCQHRGTVFIYRCTSNCNKGSVGFWSW